MWVELEGSSEGGLVDVLPGDLVLTCDRSAVFIFRLEIENGATGLSLGGFDPHSTVVGLHRLPIAMEYGALLAGAPNAKGRGFSKNHLFAGFYSIRWTDDGEQDTGTRFLHADCLGEYVEGTCLKESVVDIADGLGVEVVELGLEEGDIGRR